MKLFQVVKIKIESVNKAELYKFSKRNPILKEKSEKVQTKLNNFSLIFF